MLLAEVFAGALLAQHFLIDLTGGDVGLLAQEDVEETLDVFGRMYVPETDPDCTQIGVRAHGRKHMAQSDLAGRAGSPGRHRHAFHVEGDLRQGLDAVDALLAGFPAGTVSGAPKIRAMQIIDEMETHRRGIYGGAVGYFGWNGDLDTCIALRTAVLKDGMLHIQAGGGVVLDSDPQYEYDETVHKAGALKRAAELAAAYEFDQ